MIEVVVNGEARQVPENLTLRTLLEFLGLPTDRVAIERNLQIVSQPDWDKVRVEPADRLEIVHFVGGG